jgi:uncharacterized NAD(P)/FAD-binding protein YdhS
VLAPERDRERSIGLQWAALNVWVMDRLRLIQPGPLALGTAARADGAVLDDRGEPASRLFAMGPPLRGMWWESTAVTDVTSQAKALAGRLVGLQTFDQG